MRLKFFDAEGNCVVELQDRDLRILNCFVHQKHLTLLEARDLFWPGCNPRRAPYRRILKLIAAGLLAVEKISTEPKDVYVPTRKTVQLLKRLKVPFAMGLPKRRKYQRKWKFKHYEHDAGITALRIFFKRLEIGIWVPERVVRSIRPHGASPDAVVLTRDANYAIEYEISEKKLERYGDVFNRYENKEYYRAVLYITESEAHIKKLKEKYWRTDHVFYITREELFAKKEETVFRSRKEVLPMRKLIRNSLDGGLEDMEREYLENSLSGDIKEDWKFHKPFSLEPGDEDDALYKSEEEYRRIDAEFKKLRAQGLSREEIYKMWGVSDEDENEAA